MTVCFVSEVMFIILHPELSQVLCFLLDNYNFFSFGPRLHILLVSELHSLLMLSGMSYLVLRIL